MKDRLVTLARFLWLDDAQQAASVLRGYGIQCFVGDRHILSWYPHLSAALRGVKLQVRASQVSDAMEILQQFREKLVWCPSCGSANVAMGRRRGWLAFAVFALGGIPVRPLPRAWRCDNCGYKWKARD